MKNAAEIVANLILGPKAEYENLHKKECPLSNQEWAQIADLIYEDKLAFSNVKKLMDILIDQKEQKNES